MPTDTAAIRDLLDRYTEAQHAMQDGCGDGHCVVRKTRGMHTNGGCRCLYLPDHLTTQRAGHIMRIAQEMEATILALCDAQDEAQAEIERLKSLLDRHGVGPAERYWEGRWRDEAAENERLRAGLRPFAKAGALFAPIPEGLSDMVVYKPAAGADFMLTGTDLRRAYNALKSDDTNESTNDQ